MRCWAEGKRVVVKDSIRGEVDPGKQARADSKGIQRARTLESSVTMLAHGVGLLPMLLHVGCGFVTELRCLAPCPNASDLGDPMKHHIKAITHMANKNRAKEAE